MKFSDHVASIAKHVAKMTGTDVAARELAKVSWIESVTDTDPFAVSQRALSLVLTRYLGDAAILHLPTHPNVTTVRAAQLLVLAAACKSDMSQLPPRTHWQECEHHQDGLGSVFRCFLDYLSLAVEPDPDAFEMYQYPCEAPQEATPEFVTYSEAQLKRLLRHVEKLSDDERDQLVESIFTHCKQFGEAPHEEELEQLTRSIRRHINVLN